MRRTEALTNCLITVLPLIIIEWKQFDKISRYLVFWIVIYLYYSFRFYSTNLYSRIPPLYANIIAASIQSAFLLAAVDVRFIHISDDVDTVFRSAAAAMCSILIILEVSIVLIGSGLNNSNNWNEIRNLSCSQLSVVYFLYAAILITAQVSLNSRVSVLLALPGSLLSLLWAVELNKKKPWKRLA